MRPSEVLDHQGTLLQMLSNPDSGFRKIVVEHAKLQVVDTRGKWLHKHPEVLEGEDPDLVGYAMAQLLVESVRVNIQAAYAYKVEPDMMTLVEFAATQLDETDGFNRELAPTGCGIARFDQPLRLPDVRGNQQVAHWLVWGPVQWSPNPEHNRLTEEMSVDKPITGVWLYNDAYAEPDYYTREVLNDPDIAPKVDGGMRRFMPLAFDTYGNRMNLGPATLSPDDAYAAEITAGGGIPTSTTNIARFVHALWLMMGQTIAAPERAEIERHAAKRARRMNLPGRVTVIKLRRYRGAERTEGESMIEWSHRWVVRGHWRWQYHGHKRVLHAHDYSEEFVLDGGLVRYCSIPGCDHYSERIWIAPFVKGPESKPIIVTDKVYNLAR